MVTSSQDGSNPTVFTSEIQRNINRPTSLNVFNTKNNKTRGKRPQRIVWSDRSRSAEDELSLSVIQVIPRHWEGERLLGLNIRFDSYEQARDNILHITVGVVRRTSA